VLADAQEELLRGLVRCGVAEEAGIVGHQSYPLRLVQEEDEGDGVAEKVPFLGPRCHLSLSPSLSIGGGREPATKMTLTRQKFSNPSCRRNFLPTGWSPDLPR
jgi:hypothetical protein